VLAVPLVGCSGMLARQWTRLRRQQDLPEHAEILGASATRFEHRGKCGIPGEQGDSAFRYLLNQENLTALHGSDTSGASVGLERPQAKMSSNYSHRRRPSHPLQAAMIDPNDTSGRLEAVRSP
jgi:hypothetical protein